MLSGCNMVLILTLPAPNWYRVADLSMKTPLFNNSTTKPTLDLILHVMHFRLCACGRGLKDKMDVIPVAQRFRRSA